MGRSNRASQQPQQRSRSRPARLAPGGEGGTNATPGKGVVGVSRSAEEPQTSDPMALETCRKRPCNATLPATRWNPRGGVEE